MTEIKCYDCGKHADVIMLDSKLSEVADYAVCVSCFIAQYPPKHDIHTFVNGQPAIVRTIVEEEDSERTAAENYFTKRMEDPAYAAAYHVVRAKLEK
jgi:hypothetical protein